MVSVVLAVIIIVALVDSIRDTQKNAAIGVICDLNGVNKEYGKWVRNGVSIAVEAIKESDPGFAVYIEDGQTDKLKTGSAYDRLTSLYGVRMIVCGCYSPGIMALDKKADSTQVLLMSTVASSPSMAETGKYLFSNRVLGKQEVECLADHLEDFNIRTVAIVAPNNEAGIPYVDAFMSIINEKDVKVLAKVFVDQKGMDFRTELIKLKGLNPDAVILITPEQQSLNLVKQARGIDFSTKWFGISAVRTPNFIKNGGRLVEGMVVASECADEGTPQYSVFKEKYCRSFNEQPTFYAENGYDAVMLFYNLSKKYGNDVKTAQHALYTESFLMLSGEVSFDTNGMILHKEVGLYVIKDGQFTRMNI